MAKKRYDPTRSVRVSDEVWNRASRRAVYDGQTMSKVIVLLLQAYGAGMLDLPEQRLVYPARKPAATTGASDG